MSNNTENAFYVYAFLNKNTNEIIYIGKGKDGRYKNISKRNKLFKQLYNPDIHEPKILVNGLTEAKALWLEKYLIYYFRKVKHYNLTNITDGGDGGKSFFHPEWSDERRLQMSKLVSGVNNPNYGNHWSDAMKLKLSKKQSESGRYVGAKNPNSKKVQCVETQEVFLTMTDAAQRYGLKYPSSIWHALKSPNRIAAGYHWRLLN